MRDGKTIAILPDEQGERLDKVLAKRLHPLTRSQIKKLIESGRVSRNGKPATVHAFVTEGDTIVIASESDVVKTLPVVPVLQETDDYLVISKPAGLLVHKTNASKFEPTLADWLINHFPPIAGVGEEDRPGIVHRLDRDTSGVMVIAKTPPMFASLKKQFQDRTVRKSYVALVHGRPRADEGEINLPIGRSRRSGRMAARPLETYDTDKIAITKFTIVKRFRKPFCLVHAFPLTGRTHQIRAHLMAYGHPVVGDTLYTAKRQPIKVKLGRQFLHAESLTFHDLNGQEITAQAPMPDDLQQYLQQLV